MHKAKYTCKQLRPAATQLAVAMLLNNNSQWDCRMAVSQYLKVNGHTIHTTSIWTYYIVYEAELLVKEKLNVASKICMRD